MSHCAPKSLVHNDTIDPLVNYSDYLKLLLEIYVRIAVCNEHSYANGPNDVNGWKEYGFAGWATFAWGVAWASYEKGIKLMGVATEGQGGSDEDD